MCGMMKMVMKLIQIRLALLYAPAPYAVRTVLKTIKY